MDITEYFASDSKERLLAELKKCRWEAGKLLYDLLSGGKVESFIGDDPKVFMMTDVDKLVSFCTLAKKDDIPDTELTPWIGFVYTFPKYRGKHLAGKLIRHAENEARTAGYEKVFISTDHTGLYEKYGYTFYGTAKDVSGNSSRIYTKNLKEQWNER